MAISSSSTVMMEESEVARDKPSLNVLVVDSDESSLLVLEKLLQDCNHTVTKCKDDNQCIQMIRENGDNFHMVMIDADVSAVGGFELCRLVRDETTIPIILMSSTYSTLEIVQKALDHGACEFLLKPITAETMTKIELDVLRSRALKRGALLRQESVSEDEKEEDTDRKDPSEVSVENLDKKDPSEVSVSEPNLPHRKKPRTIWTTELKAKFLSAVNKLGSENSVPKKIMEIMNVPDLTRENVASHLQKYRQSLKKTSGKTTKIQEHVSRKGQQDKQPELKTNEIIPSPTPRAMASEFPGFSSVASQHKVFQGQIDAFTLNGTVPLSGFGQQTTSMNQDANNELCSLQSQLNHEGNELLHQPIEPQVYQGELSILNHENFILDFPLMQGLEQNYYEGVNVEGNDSMYLNFSTSSNDASTPINYDLVANASTSPYYNSAADYVSTPIYCDPVAYSASIPSFYDPAANNAINWSFNDSSANIASILSFNDPTANIASILSFNDPTANIANNLGFNYPAANIASTSSFNYPAANIASTSSFNDPAANIASTPSFNDHAVNIASTLAYNDPAANRASTPSFNDPAAISARTLSYFDQGPITNPWNQLL